MKLLLLTLFALMHLITFSQNDCSTAYQYCGNDVNLTLSTNVPDFGAINCLAATPNATWFYFEVDQPGDINTSINGTTGTGGSGIDIDLIIFGPLPSYDCSVFSNMSSVPVALCDYSTSGFIPYSLTNVQAGDVYVLIVTNYSNTAGFAEFTDEGSTATFNQTNCFISNGVEEFQNQMEGFTIVNPFEQYLSIDKLEYDDYHLSIYDLSGKIIYTENKITDHFNIDLSYLSNGCFILELKSENNKTITKKIIKH